MFKMFNRRLISVAGCPVRAPGRNAPLVRLSISALYILFGCLYRMLPHLPLLLHFFLTYLIPSLSFPLRTDPLRFQAGCRKRRLNLLQFFVFILCCSTCLLIGECMLCCVRLSFFPYQEMLF